MQIEDRKILLDVKGAADALSVSEGTVRNLTAKKHIKAVFIGRRVLYRPEDLKAYVDKLAEGDESVMKKKAGRKRLAAV